MIDPVLQPHEDAAELEQLVRQANDRGNAHRASLGLTQLTLDARISRVARRHSVRMAQGGASIHQGFKQRATAIGRFMPYRTVAENLVYNYGNADPTARAFNSWFNSPKRILASPTPVLRSPRAPAADIILRSCLCCLIRRRQLP
tara:strand:- start:30 stop:464 length:435 start_codon:yes stop_codon:yes gene_type:complete